MCGDHLRQITGQIWIAVDWCVKTVPVVAHVGHQYAACRRQPLGNHVPIARGPEQAMHDQDGRLGRIIPMSKQIEHACVSTVPEAP